MYTPESFNDELAMIKSPGIRDFTKTMLGRALPYFWTVPSYSGGKYHPPQSNGEGGLVRHTKAATYFAAAFSRSFELNQRDTDRALSATILHDLCKYGVPGGKFTTKMHDKESADYVLNLGKGLIDKIDDFTADDIVEICKGIAFHMGPWTAHDRKKRFPEDYSKLEIVVHIADMASAQKEVSISYLMEPSVGIG